MCFPHASTAAVLLLVLREPGYPAADILVVVFFFTPSSFFSTFQTANLSDECYFVPLFGFFLLLFSRLDFVEKYMKNKNKCWDQHVHTLTSVMIARAN
jgi:hypothetical protein